MYENNINETIMISILRAPFCFNGTSIP